MSQKQLLVIVALSSGMALGLLSLALVGRLSRLKNRLLRSACAIGTPLCLITLPLLIVWLAPQRLSGIEHVRHMLAFSLMGSALAIVMELGDEKRKKRQAKGPHAVAPKGF